jgi:uncharacterized protein (TIGR03437 family)
MVAPAQTYNIRTVAGIDANGDGGPALNALLSQAEGIAVDGTGSVYIADAADNRVRKITPDGKIETFAGTGVAGFAGDGGPDTAALLNQPYGLAVDTAGNVYIADLGNARVRKVSIDGTIQTIAGGGSMVASGSSTIPAANAQFLEPRNIAVDPNGTVYISDFAANIVYQIAGGMLSIFAGTGNAGFGGDGSSATQAQLKAPAGLASDGAGNVYIADSGNNRIRKVSHGIISSIFTTIAPTGVAITSGGTLYIASAGYFGTQFAGIGGLTPAVDVAVDKSGNVFVTEMLYVREISKTGTNLIAGTGAPRFFGGDGGPATEARLHVPSGLTQDSAGNWYIADAANHRVRKIDLSGVITTIAGTGTPGINGDNGLAAQAQLNGPLSVAADSRGDLYVADTGNNALRKITPGGMISTVSTQLNVPSYVAVGPDQSVYVADTGNNRVVRFTPSGMASTVIQALAPSAVMVDAQGNVYVSTQSGVSKLSSIGALTTVLDRLKVPRGLGLAANGDLLICETGANVIRRVPQPGGSVIIAGNGVAGFSGDSGVATSAKLNTPEDIAIDATGQIWIADSANNRIRVLTPSSAPAQTTAAMTLVNAASMAGGPIAAGEIVSIFGAGFVPDQTQVMFDHQPATTFYVGANQINALAPAQFTANSTEISIAVNGINLADWTANVTGSSPALFTLSGGTGQAAATNEDGSVNSPANPAQRGSIVTFYATGQGSAPAVIALTVGNYPAELLYAGPAPGFPGLMQINAQIPGGFLSPGVQPVVLTVGPAASQSGVTIALQ